MTRAKDPTALLERRRIAWLEQRRTAEDRWRRFQAANRRRYAARSKRKPSAGLAKLLTRGKWPGRVALLANSGLWEGQVDRGLGTLAGPATDLVRYVRAGPDPTVQPRALFDQAWYLERAPALAGTPWPPLVHYLILGDMQGLSPHALLDGPVYRERQGAKMALRRLTALEHFLFEGAAEGADPHPLFDVRFYVGQSEDLARSGGNPLVHYLRRGWREGLDPHPLFANDWYLEQSPDEPEIAPLLHYLVAGAREGRDPHPLFDTAWYLKQGGARSATGDALGHFLQAGARELKSPHPYFDPGYCFQNADASPGARANPLLHYLSQGAFEGAWPGPDFDEGAYLAANPQAAETAMAALDHWARNGDTPGRATRPAGERTVSAQALFAELRAAGKSETDGYDVAAYVALSGRGGQTAAVVTAPPPPARDLASVPGLEVVRLGDGSAADAAGAEFILLVEAGLRGAEGWERTIIARLAGAERGLALTPRVLDDQGRLAAAGARVTGDGRTLWAGGGEDPAQSFWSASREVDAAAAALALPRSALDAVGGLDKTCLTPQGVLTDLSLRLRERGYRIFFEPGATLVRAGEGAPRADVARDEQQLVERWAETLEGLDHVRTIAFRRASAPDWLAVARALPNYRGHLQPKLPAYGFADPLDAAVLQRDITLARRYGLFGFCHELDGASDAARLWTAGAGAFPFCLAWSGDADPEPALEALAPGLAAEAAIRIGARPVLVLPADAEPGAWRAAAQGRGLGDLHLVQRGGRGDADPRDAGFDARVETVHPAHAPAGPPGPLINPDFRGLVCDYAEVVAARMGRRPPAWPQFRCVAPGWDATPGSQDAAVIWQGASPGAFQAWLEAAEAAAREESGPGERLVFVQAWNDWMAGACLEPDLRFGHGWLEALANAADAELLER